MILGLEAGIYEKLGPHPGIIGYFGRSEDGGLILEYARYQSILHFWRDYELTPVHIHLRWCIQIAEGLNHVHSHGVVHGNLAPTNILITSELDAKLCDFGGSAVEGSFLYAFGLPPFYRIPSRIDPVHVVPYLDRSDDMFALGHIILSIFETYCSYSDLPMEEVIRRYSCASGPILPPISNIVDSRLHPIIKKCWSNTYTRPQEVAVALQSIQAQLPFAPLLGHDPVRLTHLKLIYPILTSIVY
ncbi:kinase-like domain-containing protein [Hysterangium stoloniferum]|nr:kinase-like domain-containing protein [Hysterangium stoloniferum]